MGWGTEIPPGRCHSTIFWGIIWTTNSRREPLRGLPWDLSMVLKQVAGAVLLSLVLKSFSVLGLLPPLGRSLHCP